MATKKELSLILSGGASRGAYHLGALQALDDMGIEICEISGASIGAIIGASYISGKKPSEIFDFFVQHKFKKALKFNLYRGSLYRIDYESKILDELIGGDYKNIEDLPKPLYVCVTNLEKGCAQYIDRGDIRKIVCASGSLYPIFSPVIHNGERLVDGGVIDNFPLYPLLNSKHKILGINLHPNVYKSKQSIVTRIGFLAWHTAGMEEKIKRCDYYLTSDKLSYHFILKTKDIDKLFTLGYEDTCSLFRGEFEN